MKKTIKISDAEWQVMKLLWGKSPITPMELHSISQCNSIGVESFQKNKLESTNKDYLQTRKHKL